MTDRSSTPVLDRLVVKRFGRNAVVVFPRIGRKKLQATIYTRPSNVLVGVAAFVNDDGEREVHVGLGLVLVEVTFWTWTPWTDPIDSDDTTAQVKP